MNSPGHESKWWIVSSIPPPFVLTPSLVKQGGVHHPTGVVGVQGHPAGPHDTRDPAQEARAGPHAEGVHPRAHRRGKPGHRVVEMYVNERVGKESGTFCFV